MKNLLLLLIGFLICSTVFSQTDTLIYQQKQIQTQAFIQNQQQQQQQIQQQFSNYSQKIFGAVNDVVSERNATKKEIKKWYTTTLDSIRRGLIANLTIEDLDKIRKERMLDSDIAYYHSIDFLYSENKYKAVRVFPAFNNYMSMLYYNADKKFDFFQNTNLSFGGDNASFETEAVSGYLWIFRTSLTSTLSREYQETIDPELLKGLTDNQLDSLVNIRDSINIQSNTLLKLISGGGEANLKFRAPLLNIWGNEPRNIKIKSDLYAQISADLPSVGNSIPEKDISLFNVFGIENKLLIPVINFDSKTKEGYEAFSFFGKFDIKNVGGTPEFYKNLSIPEQRFWYSEYSIGINYKNYLIYYTDQIFYEDNLAGENRGRLNVALVKQF